MASEEKSKGEPTRKQRQAIEHVHGPMLVVAGAGCGKTRVLSARIAHLIRHGHARADEILAVTYTKNAAQELRERVAKLLQNEDGSQLQAMTFHSYCENILTRHNKRFAVLDETDLKVYLRRQVAELPLKIFTKAADPAQFIDDLVSFNSRCLDELVSADEFSQYVKRLERDASLPIPRVVKEKELAKFTREQMLERCQEIAAVYSFVTQRLRANGWGTFGDMLHDAVALLRSDAQSLAEEQRRCRFVLIDEFQDCNHAQIELARLLGGSNRNVFGVGDPDQGIYKFRGATAEAFEEFRARFPGCVTVRLDDNFRSTQTILDCAHAVIAANPSAGDTDRDLKAAKRFATESPVNVMLAKDWQVEASTVADHIQGLHNDSGTRWDEIAVLYSRHKIRELTVAELQARNVPVQVIGAELTETPELRDVLAVARAMEATDDSVALFRVSALPIFALDDRELQAALQSAERRVPLVRTLRSVKGGAAVLAAIEKAKAMTADQDMLTVLNAIQRTFALPDSAPLEELRKFVSGWMEKPICSDPRLAGFLEYLDLFIACGGRLRAEQEAPNGGVKFMTAYGAKGLEFRHVIVLHCSSGSFPVAHREELFEFPAALSKTRHGHQLDPKRLHEEEQRRLFYVAMTRAEESLTVCGKLTGKGEAYAGFAKELLQAKSVAKLLQRRDVRQARVTIQAKAAEPLPIELRVLSPTYANGTLRLSASAIEAYERCPLQYKLEKDWKLPGEIGAHMQYGAAIHIAMKAYFDAVRVGRTIDEAALLASFDEEMTKTAAEHEAHQHKLFIAQGRRQLSAFYTAQNEIAEPKVLATEKWFDIVVEGVKVCGSMDRVDQRVGGVHVCDYKTGRPRTEEDAEKSLQLGVYALAARELYGSVASLSFHNLEDNTIVTTERTRADLIDVEKKIADVSQKIRAGEFSPKKEDFKCRSCAYRPICPAHEQKTYTIAKAVATVQ